MPKLRPAWRDLTPEERKAEPGHKLGGDLALLFWVCVVIVVAYLVRVTPALLLGIAFAGGRVFFELLAELFAGPGTLNQKLYTLQDIVLILWAATFIILIITRSRSAPRIVPIFFAAYVAMRIWLPFATTWYL